MLSPARVVPAWWPGIARALVTTVLLCLPLCVSAAVPLLRVAVISDLNGAYGSAEYDTAVRGAVAALRRLQPGLVISTGDMVAGQRLHPVLQADRVEAMWSAFHAVVTDPRRGSGIPLAVTPGNHDASAYPLFTHEREIYAAQWTQRVPSLEFVDRAGYPFHYAFAVGGVLFVSLDVTRVGVVDRAQKAWLDALLSRHGDGYAYRVVFSHLPLFAFTEGRETEISADAELEALLRMHRVDLYLSGHHHAFYPGFRDGVAYIGQACLGAGPRRLLGSSGRSRRAVTWLEFSGEGVTVDALSGVALDERIDVQALPPRIASRLGTLVRLDLAPETTAPRVTAAGASE